MPDKDRNTSKKTAALLVPLLLLVAAELVLRATGWGLPTGGTLVGWNPVGLPLYECKKSGDAKICKTSRYYISSAVTTSFLMPKPEGTVRIFCTGGSTTAGYPFFKPIAFAKLLSVALSATDPYNNYEVINAGIPGASSYETAETVRHLMDYNPDWIVVYNGNNEYLVQESVNVGSMSGIGKSVRKHANRLRLYKLIVSARLRLSGSYGDVKPLKDTDTIVDMSESFQKRVLETSPTNEQREMIRGFYADNLGYIAKLARGGRAGLMLSTVPVNVLDYPPYEPELAIQNAEGCSYIDKSQACEQAELSGGAIKSYLSGCCDFKQGRKNVALTSLNQAIETDPLPNRATPSMNAIIREMEDVPGVHVVDVEAVFASVSGGIPGDGLFLDPHHPAIEGQSLIALALVRKLVDSGAVNPSPGWNERVGEAIDRYLSMLPAEQISRAYYTDASQNAGTGHIKRAIRLCNRALLLDPENDNAKALLDSLKDLER